MKERVLIVLFATLCLGGCLKILGDYDLNGVDPPKSGSTPTDAVPCGRRAVDGWCACDTASTLADAGFIAPASCDFPSSGGKCCAFDDWPKSGNCLCASFRCLELIDNSLSCVCGHYAAPEPDSGYKETSGCNGGSMGCCQGPGACYCNGPGAVTCKAGQTQVDFCELYEFASSVPCGEGGTATSYCRL